MAHISINLPKTQLKSLLAAGLEQKITSDEYLTNLINHSFKARSEAENIIAALDLQNMAQTTAKEDSVCITFEISDTLLKDLIVFCAEKQISSDVYISKLIEISLSSNSSATKGRNTHKNNCDPRFLELKKFHIELPTIPLLQSKFADCIVICEEHFRGLNPQSDPLQDWVVTHSATTFNFLEFADNLVEEHMPGISLIYSEVEKVIHYLISAIYLQFIANTTPLVIVEPDMTYHLLYGETKLNEDTAIIWAKPRLHNQPIDKIALTFAAYDCFYYYDRYLDAKNQLGWSAKYYTSPLGSSQFNHKFFLGNNREVYWYLFPGSVDCHHTRGKTDDHFKNLHKHLALRYVHTTKPVLKKLLNKQVRAGAKIESPHTLTYSHNLDVIVLAQTLHALPERLIEFCTQEGTHEAGIMKYSVELTNKGGWLHLKQLTANEANKHIIVTLPRFCEHSCLPLDGEDGRQRAYDIIEFDGYGKVIQLISSHLGETCWHSDLILANQEKFKPQDVIYAKMTSAGYTWGNVTLYGLHSPLHLQKCSHIEAIDAMASDTRLLTRFNDANNGRSLYISNTGDVLVYPNNIIRLPPKDQLQKP